MYGDVRGGDPVALGSCLSGLEDQQQFQTWVSMHELGMLDDHEITFDTRSGSFRLVTPDEGEENGAA